MDAIGQLRAELIAYVRRKFATRRAVADSAEEVVQRAFLEVVRAAGFDAAQYNFGYMSVACLRVAYKVFHRGDHEDARLVSLDHTPLIDEAHFVEEVERAEDCAFIFQSLQVLKDVEQIIIRERYYGNFSFKQISETHGINLNTVLSHHRRALEKLRPAMAKYFHYDPPNHYYGKEWRKSNER